MPHKHIPTVRENLEKLLNLKLHLSPHDCRDILSEIEQRMARPELLDAADPPEGAGG